jgi:ribosomal protein S17
MANLSPLIEATLATYTNGTRLCRYVLMQGALQGQSRIGFINKVGKPVKSIPGHIMEGKPTKPKAPKAAVVAVAVTAEAPRESKVASTRLMALPIHKEGESWKAYTARCKAAGFGWTEASAGYDKERAQSKTAKASKASKASTVQSRKSASTVVIEVAESPTDCITDKRAARKASMHAKTTSLSDTVAANSAGIAQILALLQSK